VYELSFVSSLSSSDYKLHVWIESTGPAKPGAKADISQRLADAAEAMRRGDAIRGQKGVLPPRTVATAAAKAVAEAFVEASAAKAAAAAIVGPVAGASASLVPITGSPFAFAVGPAAISLPHCMLKTVGPASKGPRGGGALVAGTVSILRLSLRDAFGNPVRGAAAAVSGAATVLVLPPAEPRLETRHQTMMEAARLVAANEPGEDSSALVEAAPAPEAVAAATMAAAEAAVHKGVEAAIWLDESDDASLLASVTLCRTGQHSARASVRGAPLPQMAICQVEAGGFTLKTSTLSGDGLRRAVGGVRSSFRIEARDGCGNVCSGGGLMWRVSIRGTDAALPIDVEAAANEAMLSAQEHDIRITDLEDGYYEVSYCVCLAGRYTVRVEHIRRPEGHQRTSRHPEVTLLNETSLNVVPAPIDPSACVFTFPDASAQADDSAALPFVVAGELALCRLLPYDASGNVLPAEALREGMKVELVSEGANADVTAEVLLHDDAIRAADETIAAVTSMPPPRGVPLGAPVGLRACTGGRYSLHVTLHGVHIKDSPLPLRVIAAPTHAPSCAMTFSGAPMAPTADEVSEELGAPPQMPPPVPPVASTAEPLPPLPPSLAPEPHANVWAYREGFGQPARPGTASSALTLAAGAQVTATITARDRYGNARTVGGDMVRLLLSSDRRVSAASVTDHADGTYTCEFEAKDAGSLAPFLSVNGVAVASDAFGSMHVLAAAPYQLLLSSRAQPVFEGLMMPPLGEEGERTLHEGSPPLVAPLSSPIEIAVRAHDAFGNVTAIDKTAITARAIATDGETEAALVQVVDALPSFATSSDGEVAAVVRLSPVAAGELTVEVSYEVQGHRLSETARFEVIDGPE
jgi:hypothetical protein